MESSFDEPDWPFWGRVGGANVWRLVFLTFGWESKGMTKEPWFCDLPFDPVKVPDGYWKRLHIFESHVGRRLPRIDSANSDVRIAEVDVRTFFQFAEALGYEPPAGWTLAVNELESTKASEGSDLMLDVKAARRQTWARILTGIAVYTYKHSPSDAKSDAPAKILHAVEKAGLTLSKNVPLEVLRQAWEWLSDDDKNSILLGLNNEKH